MTRPFAVVYTHRAGLPEHRRDKGYERKRKPRRFVVAVTECQVCHIVRECVNDVCDVCRANCDGQVAE